MLDGTILNNYTHKPTKECPCKMIRKYLANKTTKECMERMLQIRPLEDCCGLNQPPLPLPSQIIKEPM